MSVEIYFSGFICHIGPSEEEGSDRTTLFTSILISDGDNHVPRIRTSADPPTNSGGAGKSDTVLGQKLNTGVTFAHLGRVAKADGLFLDNVPHLDDLTRSGVRLHRDPPGLQVQLPAGCFTVVKFYEQGANWKLDNDVNMRPCVPRVTMLTAKGSDARVNFNGKEVLLGSRGWVLITNLEAKQQEGVTYVDGTHWKKQHTVTTGSPDDIATYEKLRRSNRSRTCNKPITVGKYTDTVLKILKKYRTADTSECTNTHWP